MFLFFSRILLFLLFLSVFLYLSYFPLFFRFCFGFRLIPFLLFSDFFPPAFFNRFFPRIFPLIFLWAFFCTYEYMLYENRTSLFLNLLLLLKQKRAHPACYVYSMLSSNIFHSTAQQHNQPCTKQRSTYVPITVRQRSQADNRREPACRRASAAHCAAHCVLKTLQNCVVPLSFDVKHEYTTNGTTLPFYL